MQVDSIKPKLKASGTKRIKLQCVNWFQIMLSISTCAATPRGSTFSQGVTRWRSWLCSIGYRLLHSRFITCKDKHTFENICQLKTS